MSTSHYQRTTQLNKTTFRTLYKDRSSKSLGKQRKTSSLKVGQHLSLQKLHTKLDHLQKNQPITPQKIEMSPIKNALQRLNFEHHNPEECLCGSCQCKRHMCKFKIIKPDLVKMSSYQRHYPMKISLQSDVLIQRETKPLNGDHIDLNSSYRKSFKDAFIERLNRPRPEDSLKEVGPLQSFTTYQNAFKDFKLSSQYIKPTDRYTRDYFPFRSRSQYSKDFTSKPINRSQSLKSIDRINLGKLWLGESTYNKTFKEPQRDILNPLAKHIEKMGKTIDDALRFRTNYKSDYTEKTSAICPAKKQLQQSIKFLDLKNKLSENGDFKTMSPEFHAISTSKHFYV